MLIVDADPEICLYLHFCCRWLQIAKKMLAKSKKEGGSGFETSGKSTNGRRPLPHPASGQSLATVGQSFNFGLHQSSFLFLPILLFNLFSSRWAE